MFALIALMVCTAQQSTDNAKSNIVAVWELHAGGRLGPSKKEWKVLVLRRQETTILNWRGRFTEMHSGDHVWFEAVDGLKELKYLTDPTNRSQINYWQYDRYGAVAVKGNQIIRVLADGQIQQETFTHPRDSLLLGHNGASYVFRDATRGQVRLSFLKSGKWNSVACRWRNGSQAVEQSGMFTAGFVVSEREVLLLVRPLGEVRAKENNGRGGCIGIGRQQDPENIAIAKVDEKGIVDLVATIPLPRMSPESGPLQTNLVMSGNEHCALLIGTTLFVAKLQGK